MPSVDEMRNILLKRGMDEATVARMNKKDLLAATGPEEPKFNISFIEEEKVKIAAEPASMADALPQYGSPEWQAYILSLFNPDEQINGFPRCFGLRRVAQLVLGPIIDSRATVVSVIPTEKSRAVTVNYEVTFDWTLNREVWVNPNIPYAPSLRTFGGMADCIEDEKTPWGKNPAATAETKAMSRALKTALCINILSAEEKLSGYDEKMEEAQPTVKITDQLIGFINAKANALKLDLTVVMKDLNWIAGRPLKELSQTEGTELFKVLNSYQQN